jgi:hypothetical protein
MRLFRAREDLDLLDMPQENFMMSCPKPRTRVEKGKMTPTDISNLLDEVPRLDYITERLMGRESLQGVWCYLVNGFKVNLGFLA